MKSALDQCARVLQALVDTAGDFGYFRAARRAMTLVQMIHQARWASDRTTMCLPHVEKKAAGRLAGDGYADIGSVVAAG